MPARNRKPNHVGLVFQHSLAYYRRALRGVWRFAESRPAWQLTPIPPERGIKNLRDRFRPDGLIVTANTRGLDRELKGWDRPAVNVSAVITGQRFVRVGVDNDSVGRMAAAHFLERGLRRFAFVGPARQQFSVLRRDAYCDAVAGAGGEVACFVSRSQREFDPMGMRWDLETEVDRWLRKLPKPVGVFAPNDVWGVQVVLACRRADLRVPEDVAVLGVDDDDLFCEMTRPGLSSIVVPAERIGFEAMGLLERLIEGAAWVDDDGIHDRDRPPREAILLPPVGVHTRRSSEVLAIDDEIVAEATRYIRDHADQPLTVDDVTRHVCVGRRTVERRFRQNLGTGIAAQIREAHLDRARRLLAQTDLPVQSVALRSGFDDYRQMARVFRQALAATPTAYRNDVSGSRDQ